MQLPPLERSLAPMPSPTPLPLTDIKPLTGGDAVRGGITPAGMQQPSGSHDYIGAPMGARGPDSPSGATESPNRDWTEMRPHQGIKEPEAPPPEPPLYQLLIDQVQSLWRASAQTVDIAEEAQRQAVRAQAAANGANPGPVVYADPTRVQKTSGSSSSSSTMP